MIHDIKKALLKEIFKKTNVKINMTNVEQGLIYPCFFCQYITNQIKTIASIDYLNMIDYNLIYYPKNNKDGLKEIEDIIYELNKIKSFVYEDKEITLQPTGVNVVDNVLHYGIKVYVEIGTKEEVVVSLESIRLLKELLENISLKKVFYINGNLKEVNNGFFVIEPSTTETIDNGISGFKDYEREIVIRYVDSNVNVDIYGYLEDVMDKLIAKLKGRNGIYKVNFSIDISYDNEEYEELNIINHELVIMLTERKDKIWT